MPSSNLTEILLSSLLDSPAIVELASQAGKKAFAVVKEHFTYSAAQITTAYQDGFGYALMAISIGVANDKLGFSQKILHAKITREFAEQIEHHYLHAFVTQMDKAASANFVLADFRQQTAKSLKRFAKHKDKIFQINEITETDLAALLSYRDIFAITDLVLAQMQQIEPVDETLVAFLRYQELLGDGVLFFFRELIRQDERLAKTQALLQGEGLYIEVRNLQTAVDDLKQSQAKYPFLAEQITQQIAYLQQWQVKHEQLLGFQNRFAAQLDEVLDWAQAVYANLAEIHDDVKETKAEVKETKSLAEEILQKLTALMARQDLAPQIKPRDEFTQHNSTSLRLIREALTLFKQLPTQTPEYSRASILVGSALSSSGELAQAQKYLQQAIETANNDAEKALAHFNLFQVQLRCKAYEEAFSHLQAATTLEAERYALHDTHKYPPERLLGAGGMGCVFLCNNQNYLLEAQRVVVKCFWENLTGTLDEVFKEPFLMRDIAGNYIPKPLDFGYAALFKQQRAYFVTEYLEGAIDGETWLETYGSMDLELGLQVGLQIAKGLQIAHDACIYHLDLKPANILLKKTFEVSKTSKVSISVKIIDFGLSQVAHSLRQEAIVQQSRSGLSQLGQAIFGTLDYAPPEQRGYIDYGKPSAKSDIFAFGMTMYRLWTGKNPHPFLERNLPEISALRDLLCDCVAENQAERPESAYLVKSLAAIVEEQTVKHQTEPFQQMYKAARGQKETFVDRQAKTENQQTEQAFQQMYKAARGQKETFVDRQANYAQKMIRYRYIDNSNGTVTDNQTGLVWLKNANCFGEQNWKTAMKLVAKLADGQCGLSDGSKPSDWHLPTKEEWEAMIDKQYKRPILSNVAGTDKWEKGDAFSGVQTNYYWSSTTNAYLSIYAWVVNLGNGYVDYRDKTSTNYVWPVRRRQ